MPARTNGATPIGGDRKKGGGWWKWLLALLLLALVVVAIVLLTGGGDDDEPSSTSPAASTTTTSASTAAPATTGPDTSASAPADGAGTLTAGGSSLLGGAQVADALDETATGEGLEVLAKTDGGFFVGTSEDDRVFVEYAGDVGTDEPSAGTYVPEVGDVVDLEGPVAEAPKDPARTLKLDAADADLVERQGAYVNADTVTEAG
jgi:hypothetical protein